MKINRILFCLCFAFLLSSCYSTKIYAPASDDVQLGKINEQMDTKVEKRQWFALWGLIPISEDKTPETIAMYEFNKVKVETKTTFVDWVISLFTGIVSIVPNTVVIEGSNE